MIATTTEKFITKHIARSEAERNRWKSSPRPGRGQVGRLSYGPYLLLSREEGTGCHEVAHQVAARLDWHLFDREIVNEIARDVHVRSRLIDSLDERDRAALEHILFSMFGVPTISTEDYMVHLNRTVHALGLRGDVVIVGRGAQFILPAQFGLSVRLIAPMDARVQRVAAMHNLTVNEARKRVEHVDLARAKFIRHHFRQDVSDPHGYDLIINTGSITADMASEIILRALEQKLGIASKSTPAKVESLR